MARKPVIAVTASSGNVFADIGVPEPEEALTKAQLAGRIHLEEFVVFRGRHGTRQFPVLFLRQLLLPFLVRFDDLFDLDAKAIRIIDDEVARSTPMMPRK